MRTMIGPSYVKLWLSAAETYQWANKPGAKWPCSTLANKRVFAEFDRNGLCDMAINGRNTDCDGHEFSVMVADFLTTKLPADHPCYFVAVAQFQREHA